MEGKGENVNFFFIIWQRSACCALLLLGPYNELSEFWLDKFSAVGEGLPSLKFLQLLQLTIY